MREDLSDDHESGPHAAAEPATEPAAILAFAALAGWLLAGLTGVAFHFFVLPAYERFFLEVGVELPFAVNGVLNVGRLVRDWWFVLLLLLGLTVIPVAAGWRTRAAALVYALAASVLFLWMTLGYVGMELVIADVMAKMR